MTSSALVNVELEILVLLQLDIGLCTLDIYHTQTSKEAEEKASRGSQGKTLFS